MGARDEREANIVALACTVTSRAALLNLLDLEMQGVGLRK